MDALTLLAVVQDARRTLLGASVKSVHPAGPQALWLEFLTPHGDDFLLISASDACPRLIRAVLRPALAGSPSPLAAVAQRVLPGASLRDVTHAGLDRVVTLEFMYPLPAGEAGCQLVAELFGGRPNLILVDRLTGLILEAVRHSPAGDRRSIAPEQPYPPPPVPLRADPRILETVEAIAAVLAPRLAAGLGAPVALRQSLSGLTELWAREVASRSGNGTAETLAQVLTHLLQEIQSGPWEPHLILDGAGQPMATSPIRMRHLPPDSQRACPSLGEMVERFARHLTRREAVSLKQTALRQLLRRLEIRLRSRRAKLAAETLEFGRADLSRRMGEILVAHQAAVPRGTMEVTLPNHASGSDATMAIPLDPALSPAANAERYFKGARRGRRGALRVAARLRETEEELALVHAWAERVAEASRLETLEVLHKEMEATPRLLAPRDRATLAGIPLDSVKERREQRGRNGSARRPAAGPEPRRFVSSDGFPILVGRDTEGNDYLTTHLAKSRDIWLHVQGRSGSHVVIGVPNRANGVPRRTLIQAAQLAAYYSQARSEGKVAVDYTLRKYVRKPRKAKPGLVTISQEKTIIVSPDKSLVQKLAAPLDR
jgi:predicted ribosome quality control (RQC) complex YloA/Tae2 family protein